MNTNRKYSISDNEVEVKATKILGIFKSYKQVFVNKFPVFDDPFEEILQGDIKTLATLEEDKHVLKQQQNLTEKLYSSLAKSVELTSALMLYVKISFPNQKILHDSFGKSKFAKARYSAVKMTSLMKNAYEQIMIPKNYETLVANGFTVDRVDEYLTAIKNLDRALVSQAKLKSLRPVKTKERIQAYNRVWEKMELVSNAAKLIFADSQKERKFFLLYSDRTTNARRNAN